jgi:hypothetical protein
MSAGAAVVAQGGFAVAGFTGGAPTPITVIPGTIIEDGDAPGQFFSCRAGADLGQPAGAWSARRETALRFARREDARDFARAYLTQHPNLRFVAVVAP